MRVRVRRRRGRKFWNESITRRAEEALDRELSASKSSKKERAKAMDEIITRRAESALDRELSASSSAKKERTKAMVRI